MPPSSLEKAVARSQAYLEHLKSPETRDSRHLNVAMSSQGNFPLGGSEVSKDRATATCYCGTVQLEFVRSSLHVVNYKLKRTSIAND